MNKITEEAKIKLENYKAIARVPFVVFHAFVLCFILICILLHALIGWWAIPFDILFLAIAVFAYGPFDYAVLVFYSRIYANKSVSGYEFVEGYKKKVVFKASLAFAFRFLLLFGASLLLVVPGVVLGINFSLVPIVVRRNPNAKMMEACNESTKLMMGHRNSYFWMMMRLFPWFLLGVITLGIGFIFVMPRAYMQHVVFYNRVIKGDTSNLPEQQEEEAEDEDEDEQEQYPTTAPKTSPTSFPNTAPNGTSSTSPMAENVADSGEGMPAQDLGEPMFVAGDASMDEQPKAAKKSERKVRPLSRDIFDDPEELALAEAMRALIDDDYQTADKSAQPNQKNESEQPQTEAEPFGADEMPLDVEGATLDALLDSGANDDSSMFDMFTSDNQSITESSILENSFAQNDFTESSVLENSFEAAEPSPTLQEQEGGLDDFDFSIFEQHHEPMHEAAHEPVAHEQVMHEPTRTEPPLRSEPIRREPLKRPDQAARPAPTPRAEPAARPVPTPRAEPAARPAATPRQEPAARPAPTPRPEPAARPAPTPRPEQAARPVAGAATQKPEEQDVQLSDAERQKREREARIAEIRARAQKR